RRAERVDAVAGSESEDGAGSPGQGVEERQHLGVVEARPPLPEQLARPRVVAVTLEHELPAVREAGPRRPGARQMADQGLAQAEAAPRQRAGDSCEQAIHGWVGPNRPRPGPDPTHGPSLPRRRYFSASSSPA